jgi:superfamily II DNA or RNA helicase
MGRSTTNLFVRPKKKTFGARCGSSSDERSSSSSVWSSASSSSSSDSTDLDDDLGQGRYRARRRTETPSAATSHAVECALPGPMTKLSTGTIRSLAELEAAINAKVCVGQEQDFSKKGVPSFVGVLKPFQEAGVAWIVQRLRSGVGVVLADEMGVGKTAQAIAAMLLLTRTPPAVSLPILVVSPLSVVHSWERELAKFTVGGTFRVVRYAGPREERDALVHRTEKAILRLAGPQRPPYRDVPFDVLVTTPENLLADMFFLGKISFSMLVFDEAHRLKNSGSKLFQTMLKELAHVSCRLLMTGTPVHNQPAELLALLQMANPTLTGAAQLTIDTDNAQEMEALKRVAKHLLLRRLKKDVLSDLPPMREVVVHLPMSPLQRRLYRGILRKDISVLLSEGSSSPSSLLNVLMQLRKCCNHPYMFPGIEQEPFVTGDHIVVNSSKLVFLDKLLLKLHRENEAVAKDAKRIPADDDASSASAHRVLIFSQFSSMLDILQDFLSFRDYSCARLDGSVRGEERSDVVDSFQLQQNAFVFLLSTRAGGVGLTLTAADTVVFFDSDWNPQMDRQAQERAHRIGQTREVTVYRLLCEQTVEDGIMLNASKKIAMSDALLRTSTASAVGGRETKGELKALVRWAASGATLMDVTDADEKEWKTYCENLDVVEVINSTAALTDADALWRCIQQGDAAIKKLHREALSEQCDPPARLKRNRHDDDDDDVVDATAEICAAFAVSDALHSPREKWAEHQRIEKLSRTLWRRQGYVSHGLPLDESLLLAAAIQEGERREVESSDSSTLLCVEIAQRAISAAQCAPTPKSCDSLLPDADDSVDPIAIEEEAEKRVIHLVGDVTRPRRPSPRKVNGIADLRKDVSLVLIPVNNSGEWCSRGGLFKAVSQLVEGDVNKQYAAAKANSDLRLGDAHVFATAEVGTLVVLIVVQRTSTQSRSSGGDVDLKALTMALDRAAVFARFLKKSGVCCTLHLPHLPTSNGREGAYAADRIVASHLAGLTTFVYYHSHRHNRAKQECEAPTPAEPMPKSKRLELGGPYQVDSSSTVYLVGPFEPSTSRALMKLVLLRGGVVGEELDKLTYGNPAGESTSGFMSDAVRGNAVLVYADSFDPVSLSPEVWRLHAAGVPLVAASSIN